MQRALFISDAHLGATPPHSLPDREQRLIALLQKERKTLSHLFILGDLFEFWMEYRWFIPKSSFRLLSLFQQLHDEGVEIHFFAGNHDFNLGSFFSEQLGMICHTSSTVIELQGKKIWIAHGDGLAQKDRSYRLLKRVLTHRLSNWLWKLLHPDLGMAIALWVGRKSRLRAFDPEEAKRVYCHIAQEIISREGVDAVVMGHTHLAMIEPLDGGLFVNSGEWLFDPSWIMLEEGEFRIEK